MIIIFLFSKFHSFHYTLFAKGAGHDFDFVNKQDGVASLSFPDIV